jgi:hypothetical protein
MERVVPHCAGYEPITIRTAEVAEIDTLAGTPVDSLDDVSGLVGRAGAHRGHYWGRHAYGSMIII